MIHYHGGPITPETLAVRAYTGGHAFISYREPRHLGLVAAVCQSFAVDNGAFSAWRAGESVADWSGYYAWVADVARIPGLDFAVIPDVIDGDEGDNDRLLEAWPFPRWLGAPVWHLHESLDRLERLARGWPRVCIGSSGAYSQVGTPRWWRRMAAAMDALCDEHGRPCCRMHGLRMLDGAVVTHFPFASADSTTIARGANIDQQWRGTYAPPTREARVDVLRARIEAHQAPPVWDRARYPVQIGLFTLADEEEETA